MPFDGEQAFNWDSIPVKTGGTADPAAGANWAVITVPAGKRWQILAMATVLVTAIAAANRAIQVAIADDGTNGTRTWCTQNVQIASLTGTYRWDAGSGAELYLAGIPLWINHLGSKVELTAGATITATILSKQAADDAAPFYYIYKEAPA